MGKEFNKKRGRPPETYGYDYQTIADLTGLAVDTVYQHKSRGYFDPFNMLSVILYVVEYGPLEFQQEAIERALRSRQQRGTAARSAKRKKRA